LLLLLLLPLQVLVLVLPGLRLLPSSGWSCCSLTSTHHCLRQYIVCNVPAGAGAAAARSEVAAFFRVELLRRAAMELLLPWATAAAAAAAAANRRRKAAPAGTTASVQKGTGQKVQQESGTSTGSDGLARQTVGLKAAIGADVQAAEKAAAASATAAAGPQHQQLVSDADSAAAAGLPGADQVLSELARPRYDAFTDFWDMSRDMG
jgi:hypothetical protein